MDVFADAEDEIERIRVAGWDASISGMDRLCDFARAAWKQRQSDDPAQRQDAMLERREALEAYIEDRVQWLYDAIGTCSQHPSFMPLEEDESLRECILLSGKKAMQQVADKALSRTSDEGGVPEAVRRLPTVMRQDAQLEQDQGDQRVAEAVRYYADELDRALAQSEQGKW